jgi:hypothetical protein
MNKQKNISLFLLFILLSLGVSAQNKVTVDDILQKAKEACLSIKSIEYEIHQRNAEGRYGRPTIKATITQQRAEVADVGFDKAYIKATGTIKEKKGAEPFSFAYNGDDFTYQRGNDKPKRVNAPKQNVVMGMLQQHLFMLRFFPFMQDEPFKSRGGNFKYETKEKVGEKLCYKIESVTTLRRVGVIGDKERRPMSTKEIWWIDEETYLPVAFSDGFVHKEVTILNYE